MQEKEQLVLLLRILSSNHPSVFREEVVHNSLNKIKLIFLMLSKGSLRYY
jgi:hypothetical protein